MQKKLANALLIVLFAAAIVRTIAMVAQDPELEWDMLAYMALAVSWESDDPVEIHRRTYETAERELDSQSFRKLTRSGVRRARYENPGVLYEHLAFYRSRVLYTLPVYLLHRAGAPLSDATWWMSLAAWAGTAVLILLWCERHLPLWLAVPVALGFAHAPPLLEVARQSTPDALFVAAVTSAVFALVELRSLRVAAGILLASLLVRGDAILFIFFLVGALVVLGPAAARLRLAPAAAALAAATAIYATASLSSGYYGWWPLFTIGFLGKHAHPSSIPTTPDLVAYAEVLVSQVAATTGSILFVYGALALLGLAYAHRYRRDSITAARCAAVMLAFLVSYAVRYLLFPALWERFFVPFSVLVPLLLITLVAGERRPGDSDQGPAG